MRERGALLDPPPGCRAAEPAPGSRGAGGGARERRGGLLPACAAPRGQGLLCPLPVPPSPRAEPGPRQPGRGREGGVVPPPGQPWGPSSMSQGHLLETALEIRHLPGPGRHRSQTWGSPRWPLHQGPPIPIPTAGSSTCLVPKTPPAAKRAVPPGLCCLAGGCGPSGTSWDRATLISLPRGMLDPGLPCCIPHHWGGGAEAKTTTT